MNSVGSDFLVAQGPSIIAFKYGLICVMQLKYS